MKYFILSISIIICGHMALSQEVQVPMDLDGKIMNIDESLQKKLRLFSDYKGFQEARLWQSSDSTFVLEILYQTDTRQMRIGIPYTDEDVVDLREMVTTEITRTMPERLLNQDGRTLFLTNSTAVSLLYYGPSLPIAIDIDDSRVSIALYMLTAGGGFFLSRAITRNLSMPYGTSLMTMYGQTRGILYGAMLPLLIDDAANYKTSLLFGMLGSVAGATGGYHWGEKKLMSSGEAGLNSAMGDFGALLGLATADILGFLDDSNPRPIAAGILLGSTAGLLSGKLFTQSANYTYGDALVMRTSGFLGAYSMFALTSLFDPEKSSTYSAMASLGGIGGIALGHFLARENNFSINQGFQTMLGTSAGALVGLGIGYLISPDEYGTMKVLTSFSALGAIGGFAIMTNILSRTPKEKAESISVSFNVNPIALSNTIQRKTIGNDLNAFQMPLVSASIRF